MAVNDSDIVLQNIRKEFPGVVALDGVTLTLRPGRVLGLLGENGAGKSTLMKILSGTYTSYEGKILFCGQEVRFKGEKDALEKGISIVAQELNPIPELSIAENVFLGREPKSGVFLDRKQMLQNTEALMKELRLDFNPATKMKDLSVAQKQMVEIIKAISRHSKVIIFDEPTSALTSVETEYLFSQMENLKQQGIALVFISHKLDEVFRICDSVAVLRDGKFIDSRDIGEVTENSLIAMMVGREVADIYPPTAPSSEEEVLHVENLRRNGVFEGIDFTLHKGEILGFAGMMGAGRSEVMRCIFGLDKSDGGRIVLSGSPLRIGSAKDAINAGIAMVTEDRAAYGLVGVRSIAENIALPSADMFAKAGWLQKKKIDPAVTSICQRLRVRTPDYGTAVGTLSGGNQQKVVLAKWLVRNVHVLIMDEPTRGIDVGAKQEIYRFIAELAQNGMAVILVSSELSEVLSMSHRIMVMADGRIVGSAMHGETDQDGIMKMIVEGGKRHGND